MLTFRQYLKEQQKLEENKKGAALALGIMAAGTGGFSGTMHHLNKAEKIQQTHQRVMDYIKSSEGKITERPSELDTDEMGSGIISQTYPKDIEDASRIRQLKSKNDKSKTPVIHPYGEMVMKDSSNKTLPTTRGKFGINNPTTYEDPIASLLKKQK